MQAPNLNADGGVTRTGSVSTSEFARDASAYLRYLRVVYGDRLRAGDDEGVIAAARAANIVERAALVHASARSLASVRALRARGGTEDAKIYLKGVQQRLLTALTRRDVTELAVITDAADAAMTHLANPDVAFADLEYRALGADLLDQRAAASLSAPDDASSERSMDHRGGISMLDEWPGDALPSRRCGFPRLKQLNLRDRVVLAIYLVMVVSALVAVGLVTSQFVRGLRSPQSFLRAEDFETLQLPVITLCLSRAGVPHSRMQVFNYTDARGTARRGAVPSMDYTNGSSKEFKDAVERFWDNPDNENCKEKVGDYFPLSASRLNNLTSGRVSSKCRPCYRFGQKLPENARSTAFADSSFIHSFTDNYWLECLTRPGGLTKKSVDFLHNLIIEKAGNAIVDNGVLTLQAGQTLEEQVVKKLTGQHLCNVFYFGHFPKVLKRLLKNNTETSYAYDGDKWKFTGKGTEFVPVAGNARNDDFFPLESLIMFVSSPNDVQPGSIKGLKDMVLIGPNTQTYATFHPLIVYNNSRYDVSTSTSNFIDSDVIPLFGYWLEYRIIYNYNRFIVDEYYRESTYTALQWFVDFTGYLGLFTGASMFSLCLLPVLYGLKAKERQKERRENPEAYLLRELRKIFKGKAANAPASTPVDVPHDELRRRGTSVQLPGYNL